MQESNKESFAFLYNPLISIIVPVWNTPKQQLIDIIKSVLAQIYPNFELCIADASDQSHVKEILENYAKNDSRIKIKYLECNKGIAQNTNEAISLAIGDYIAFLDHDDILSENALFEVVKTINKYQNVDFIYSDEDKVTEDGKKFFEPHFKPDFAPDTLRSYDYIGHLNVIKKELLDKIGGVRKNFEGAQDYDLILRATEKAKKIIHIPKILYHWRVVQNSVTRNPQSKIYSFDADRKALKEHLNRLNLDAEVLDGQVLGLYKINYKIINNPKISIIIPNKDHKEDLEKCINSIVLKSTYKNYEIIIAENNSTDQSIFDYYNFLEQTYPFIKVITWDKPFNYSSINNYAVKFSQGEVLLFLNNDTEIITPNWLEEMLMFAQRNDVGAVGAKLLYPDNTIQHAGIIIGINGIAEHCFRYSKVDSIGYFARLATVQNLSAVTGACLMIRKKVFNEIEGFDEGYPQVLNDIDLCLKVREKGYLVVWTPHAVLYHYESKSRGFDTSQSSIKRYNQEVSLFKSKWQDILNNGDPYYNPNLTLNKTDFSIANYDYKNQDEFYSAQGIFCLRTGKNENAKEYFQKALDLNPNNTDALFCLGAFYLQEDRLEKALEYFDILLKKDLLKLKVQLGCLYNNMGVAFIKLGKTEEGFRFIERALDLNPMYMDAQYNIKQKDNNSFNLKITRKLIM